MGVVHHANYIVWFELARTRLCSLSGFHYADIERLGYLLMVTGVEARYHRPARYGDVVRVTCWCERLGSRGLRFAYEVHKGERAAGHRDHRARLDRDGDRPAVPHPGGDPRALRAAGRLTRRSVGLSPAIFCNVGSSASVPAGNSRSRAA